MSWIKNLRKLICVIIVIGIILILLEIKPLQSVSKIRTSRETIFLDVGNARREMKQIPVPLASNGRLTMSKDSNHNVLRQFEVSQSTKLKIKTPLYDAYTPKTSDIKGIANFQRARLQIRTDSIKQAIATSIVDKRQKYTPVSNPCRRHSRISTKNIGKSHNDHSKSNSSSQTIATATRTNINRHHHDSLFNITTQPSRNSTRFLGQGKSVTGVTKTTGKTSKKSKNISGKHVNKMDSFSTEDVINKAVEWFTVHNDSLKDDRLNKHKFSYHLTSALCSKKNISIVILVHSAANHTENRQLIRNNWGSVNTDGSHQTIIFMLGETFPRDNTLQLKIEKESKKHGDIVQGDFADTYKNLSYKHVMAIHWLTSKCDDVRTIVKIDDDVFVNVFKLVNFSINIGHFPDKLYCHIENKAPPGRTGRWTLSTAEYPFPLFPRYCDGMAYIMSMDVARKLVKASENMAFFWIDDVYVTGFLARKAGIGHKNFGLGHECFLKKRHIRGKVKDILKGYMFYVHLRDWDMLAMLLFGLKK